MTFVAHTATAIPIAAPTVASNALGEQLPHDASAGCAHRQSNRELALARRSACEQEIADVRARNEQDEKHAAHQRPHHELVIVAEIGFAERHTV